MNAHRCKRFFEVLQQAGSVCNFDQNTTHLSMKGEIVRLRFNRGDGALEFLKLSTHAADLLTSGLDFCYDELELVEVFHGLTEPNVGTGVQECFPKTFNTESVAMRPRSRVFHMARKSLQALSSR